VPVVLEGPETLLDSPASAAVEVDERRAAPREGAKASRGRDDQEWWRLSRSNLERIRDLLGLRGATILEIGVDLEGRGSVAGEIFEGNLVRSFDCDDALDPDFVGDLSSTTFPDESWDVVLLNHVLERTPDYEKAVEEALRITRPGGLIILQTRFADRIRSDGGRRDFWRFTPTTCMAMLEPLQIVEVVANGGSPDNPTIISALARKHAAAARGTTAPRRRPPIEPNWSNRLLAPWSTASLPSWDLERLHATLDHLPGHTDSVLVVGNVASWWLEALEERVRRVVTVCPDAEEVTELIASGREAYDFDFHQLPFRDGEFEVVFSANVFERSLAPCVALRETSRVARRALLFALSSKASDGLVGDEGRGFVRGLLTSLASNYRLSVAGEWDIDAQHRGYLLYKANLGTVHRLVRETDEAPVLGV